AITTTNNTSLSAASEDEHETKQEQPTGKAECQGCGCRLHSSPMTKLEAKSPTALTAASVPNAMPCCCCGMSSAARESSRASSTPTTIPASAKTTASNGTLFGPDTRRSAITTASP